MSAVHNLKEVERTGAEDAFDGGLDDLLALGLDELSALYADGRVPDIESLDGDMRGRMLASALLPWPLERLVGRWAASRFFVWRGKSFRPLASSVGRGVNRLGIGVNVYPFITRVERSRAGDFDVVELDYNLPENPFFIRPITDEIRELRPGLWLGRAYLDVGREPTFALFFGLSTS